MAGPVQVIGSEGVVAHADQLRRALMPGYGRAADADQRVATARPVFVKADALALSLELVIEIGRRARSQPAPPHAVFEALANPDRDPSRPWLTLLEDEQRPSLVQAVPPSLIVWSSIWVKRPDALLRFELPRSTDGGTQLSWTLYVDEPMPEAGSVGHMRKRVNELINANLRYTFGQ